MPYLAEQPPSRTAAGLTDWLNDMERRGWKLKHVQPGFQYWQYRLRARGQEPYYEPPSQMYADETMYIFYKP